MGSSNTESTDGLEIISIGAVYNGPWDKKYWSSSRGKDRYPYPVGYMAVQTHVGVTYKMEICEGVKGPLFVVSSSDGKSGTGQTPDIAWENFQKKSSSKVKMWHGKRFSCKIDGIELFGFRNPLVQRLLRELVANVNGVAEQSLGSPSFCNGAPTAELEEHAPDSFRYPNLLLYLGKQQSTGKRSKHKSTSKDDHSWVGVKRSRSHGRTVMCFDVDNASSDRDLELQTPQHPPIHLQKKSIVSTGDGMPYPTGLEQPGHGNCTNSVASDENCALHEQLVTLPVPVDLTSVAVRDYNPVLDKYNISPDHLACESNFVEDQDKLFLPEDSKVPCFSHEFSMEKDKLLDRSSAGDEGGMDFLMVTNDNKEKNTISTECKSMHASDLCIPDTLDLLDENIADSPLGSHLGSPCIVKEEDGTYTGSSEGSSDKSEFESIGQELAKSMMQVLLPQALPLLTKSSRRKRKSIQNPGATLIECEPCLNLDSEKFPVEVNGTCHLNDVLSLGDTTAGISIRGCKAEKNENGQVLSVLPGEDSLFEAHIVDDPGDGCKNIKSQDDAVLSNMLFPQREGSDITKSIIPDSFEDDRCVSEFISQSPRHSAFCDVDQIPIGRSEFSPTNSNISESTDWNIESSHCHPGNDRNTGVTCFEEQKRVFSDNTENVSGSVDLHPQAKPSPISFHSGYCEADQSPTRKLQFSPNNLNFPVNNDRDMQSSHCDHGNDGNNSISCLQEQERNFSDNGRSVSEDQIFSDLLPQTKGGPRMLPSGFCEADQSLATSRNTDRDIASPHCHPGNDRNNAVSHFQAQERNSSDNNGCLSTTLVFSDLLPHTKTVADNGCENMSFLSESSQKNSVLGNSFSKGIEPDNKSDGFVELVGCYIHPTSVQSILLSTQEDGIYICVSCGLLEEDFRTLFIYNVPIKELRGKCPPFLSYTTILLSHFKDAFYREVKLDRSGLQLTPDGQCLVFLDSFKAPYCRERNINCLCSVCTSECSKGNAVKVASVKLGYVSTVASLETDENVYHVLVCKPYLIAVGESGRLHVWIMNSMWSAAVEKFILPGFDYSALSILELKRMPHCTCMVVGHNGNGGFGFWDISRRVLHAKFSNLGYSLFQVIPLGLFSQENQGTLATRSEKQNMKVIKAASEMWFSEAARNSEFFPSEEDMAVWLLVSATSHSETQLNPGTVGCWRLGLLTKNILIMGSILDPRACAVDVSTGCGIMGTRDGLVYMWEISTGYKQADLLDFKGRSISCITADQNSGTFAVVSDDSHVLVYIHSSRA